MIKFLKILFSLTFASIAMISCKTYLEGEKIKFHSSPVYRNTPLHGDSINHFEV